MQRKEYIAKNNNQIGTDWHVDDNVTFYRLLDTSGKFAIFLHWIFL